MAEWNQFKLLHGILLPQFLSAVGLEVTNENALAVKIIFKDYLDVASTASLSEGDMWKFIQAFYMLSAREFGVELTEDFANLTMREALNQINYDYDDI